MARIMELRVDWMLKWANSPKFVVRLDRVHPLDEMRFVEIDGSYVARFGAQVDFFHYTAPGEGYGGRKFELTMIDGSKRTLIGPWSSNSGVVNDRFPLFQCCEASVTDEVQVMKKGYTFFAGAISIPHLVAWMDANPRRGFGLAKVRWGGSTWYQPTQNGLIKDQFTGRFRAEETQILQIIR